MGHFEDFFGQFSEAELTKASRTGVLKLPESKASDSNKQHVPGVGGVNPLRGFLEAANITEFNHQGVRELPRFPSFSALREIERKNPIVSACVNLRRRQSRPFMSPSPDDDEPGYKIMLRDRDRKPTAKEKAEMDAIEQWFNNTGRTDFDGWDEREDSLQDVGAKMVNEYMTIDQVAIEIRRDRSGKPVDFWMLDGGTIRRVLEGGFQGNKNDIDPRAFMYANADYYKKLAEARIEVLPEHEQIRFVQMLQGKIVAAFTRKDIIFDALQSSVDLNRSGHGYSPTEQALGVITTFLWGLAYNSEQFNSGTLPKIALAFEEGKFGVEEMIALQDEFISNQRGVGGVWRVPMLNGKVQVLDLYKTQRDMEFIKGMEFWGALIATIYGVDTQELGLRFAQAQNVLNENQDARQKFSKDRGLHDLLGGIQNVMNRIMMLCNWSDKYMFRFTGISPTDREQASKLDTEAVKRHLTVNEYRKQQDLEPIEGGDVILDPTFLQAVQAASMGEEGGDEMGGDAGGDEMDEMVDESIEELFKARKYSGAKAFKINLKKREGLAVGKKRRR